MPRLGTPADIGNAVTLLCHQCGHNKRLTCQVLKINYRTLQSYLWTAAADSRAA